MSSLVHCIQDQASYYRKLRAELDSENNLDAELRDAKSIREEFANAIRSKKAEINSLEEYSKKEYKDVRRMRHLSFRSAAATLSGKKKERTAKEEAKYQLAFENEQRSKRELEDLETNYKSALAREEELTRQKSHFEDTRHQYESLLEQIFTLEDPNFPSEPQLKAELVNYREQKRMAKRDKTRFSEAEQALSTAMIDIKKVIRLLDTVINYVPFEIFGGPIIDEEQVAYLEAAKRKIWDIQRLLNLVRTVLPEVPYPQTLDVVTNNPLLQMQLNLNYIDIAWKAKTSQCFGLLATSYRNAQNSLTWVKQYKEYAAGALSRLETAVQVTKASLKKERRRIMDAVLSGHVDESSNSSSSEPPLFSTTYHGSNDLPPPVYEAPPSDTQDGQNQHMPAIPPNLTPSISFSNIPAVNDNSTLHSPLIPPSTLNNNDANTPPHPMTPVTGDVPAPITTHTNTNTNTSTTNTTNATLNNSMPINSLQQQQQPQPYVTHNVNNPFQ